MQQTLLLAAAAHEADGRGWKNVVTVLVSQPTIGHRRT